MRIRRRLALFFFSPTFIVVAFILPTGYLLHRLISKTFYTLLTLSFKSEPQIKLTLLQKLYVLISFAKRLLLYIMLYLPSLYCAHGYFRMHHPSSRSSSSSSSTSSFSSILTTNAQSPSRSRSVSIDSIYITTPANSDKYQQNIVSSNLSSNYIHSASDALIVASLLSRECASSLHTSIEANVDDRSPLLNVPSHIRGSHSHVVLAHIRSRQLAKHSMGFSNECTTEILSEVSNEMVALEEKHTLEGSDESKTDDTHLSVQSPLISSPQPNIRSASPPNTI
jgi:hypothetical protein